MFSILRVNTVTGETRKETDNSKAVLLGGRTLSSRMVSKEVPAQCDPLGRQNKLFFCSGALAGTTASSCHRLSIGSKSPLTGGIKESNAGGILALRMAQQDLRCIVLEDAPAEDADWKIVVIGKDKTELVDGAFLEGKGVYEKSDLLTEKFGKRAGCVTIGPAAEKRLLASGLACSDPHGVCSRYAGRGGLGAVLASKRIIAMVVLDDAKVKPDYTDKDAFKKGAKKLITLLQENPVASKFTKYGTAAMVDICQALKVLPTRTSPTAPWKGRKRSTPRPCTTPSRNGVERARTQHACMPAASSSAPTCIRRKTHHSLFSH